MGGACSIGPGPAWAEPEASNLRIVRILLLILLAVLLLPYLVTPFYRTGHPVSALMAWRWLKGAPVSRQWIDFNAISPSLPRSVVGSEDAKFCSHRGRRLGRAAGRDRRCRGRRGRPRRLDHHPAGGEKPVPVAGPQRGPQGAGTAAGDVDRSRAAQAADPGNLPQHRRTRPVRAVRGRGRRRCTRSAVRQRRCRRARRPCWRRSCPIRSGAAPAIPAPGCAVWPGPIWRGPGAVQRCWSENRAF